MDTHVAAAVRQALNLVCVSLPHLSGLAHAVRIAPDDRVGTAGVFASGRLLINREWFLWLNEVERAFVLAHELLHLALHSHERSADDHQKFNVAHDLIINDILETELGIAAPGGGVRRPGARHLSAEALMLEAEFAEPDEPDTSVGAALAVALRGRDQPLEPKPDDVLDGRLEQEWFPGETPESRIAATHAITREATRSLTLQRIQEDARKSALAAVNLPWSTGASSAYVEALRVAYRPPWELALHRWLDAVTPHRRTYGRASRRGADRTDVVLPGRSREAQILSIVLDTSGSMTEEIAHALGSIVSFSRGADIESVRIVQCDTEVTRDEVVSLDQLATYQVDGFGGSDMSPAMRQLAEDPETTAIVVITDGEIDFPDEPMPCEVLWMVYSDEPFRPHYGDVIRTSVDTL
ncbi:vWA domain-containing protein [Mycolicibacterium vanbaalenii]|uniref:Metallopeptidase domain-containing protein n=1 Tax=Mycolicibacterium vanbaalenii (strain DSM 7251 / JCM 13017 / BCRC 16820 / KCTC 9966 / NRRL B-24157 / PYR-1) TaxID=350058 RepID=A1THV2_MYCVP|nr:VWA-like domain-containing protein [Mycolicibacterium vanbaalenii]ABM16752.1 conserved hypothetical protein [Mycolicibacterium vanbaalenii PYR-1]MCV7126970.1 hypothetical protein [Mycolicibacterium vanbaalenii PYR-1]